jgi:hypothetical protein
MTSKELYKLRAALPKGSRAILAEKFGLTEGYINLVLTGHRNNEKVIIAAAEMVSEHKQKLKEATEFIQTL